METEEMLSGIVNFSKIDIYSEPNLNSEIICDVRNSTEVLIDLDSSVEDFYKIYTAFGAEGFCRKEFIAIKK